MNPDERKEGAQPSLKGADLPAFSSSPRGVYMADVSGLLKERIPGRRPLAYVKTFGCQQNVADGERIKGMLAEMGFGFTADQEEADFILFHTCAVRAHAQDRVFGNIGALKRLKEKNPKLLIAVCGCMTEQEEVSEKLKKSYPFISIVFGTHMLHRFPEILYRAMGEEKRIFLRGGETSEIYEGLPVRREGRARAYVTIMYGCNNFCSFCIVPYVRGREKSRAPERIYREVQELVAEGYKEIMLLGQNVNSYGAPFPKARAAEVSGETEGGTGKSPGKESMDFAGLLRLLDGIEGDFRIRFMSAHPKDATPAVFDAMAESRHIPHYFHLPLQSGNDRILGEMNRKYDRAHYLSLVAYARERMPDLCLTTDLIVGFPGERYEEFQDTLAMMETVGYTSIFSFIYSPRPGTKAAALPDPVSHQEKTRWYAQLLALQARLADRFTQTLVGSTQRVLVEGRNEKTGLLSGRTPGFMVAEFAGPDALIDTFTEIRITRAHQSTLWGERMEAAQEVLQNAGDGNF